LWLIAAESLSEEQDEELKETYRKDYPIFQDFTWKGNELELILRVLSLSLSVSLAFSLIFISLPSRVLGGTVSLSHSSFQVPANSKKLLLVNIFEQIASKFTLRCVKGISRCRVVQNDKTKQVPRLSCSVWTKSSAKLTCSTRSFLLVPSTHTHIFSPSLSLSLLIMCSGQSKPRV
jgi:hypothetical protein